MTSRTLPALLGSAFVIVSSGAAAAGSLPEAAPDELAALPQVSSEELAQQRGGADYYFDFGPFQENWASFDTPVTGNPIGNINGAISGNMLNHVSGISTVMYNTGNNVVFNSATQLNITLK